MEKTVITFNDLPEVVTQLRDEVMGLKSLLREQRSVNNAKAVDTHVPMSVKEAAEYQREAFLPPSPANAIAFTGTSWTDAGILPEESRTLVQ